LVSTVIKNWDNKTWLSSQEYIKSFNNYLIKNIQLNSKSKILDIGCGRGKIIGSLSSKLKFKNKPWGIDIVNHKDKDKRINFKKIDASIFFSSNKEKFDLILIKQTIHLLTINKIKKLLFLSKKNLSPNGKIFILTLNTYKNEIPSFTLMKKKLNKSLVKDKRILSLITRLYPNTIVKKFTYKVKITKKKYLKMIQKRYISILLSVTNNELTNGIEQINSKFNKILRFNDNLICIIIKK
jgi:2-polyprenyl-3-methyl-5-hydroxy-6-metoxy-1,4-benzoquinol methylase